MGVADAGATGEVETKDDSRGAVRRPTARLWMMLVVIAVAAIASTIVVMNRRSVEHLRRARLYATQEQEALRRIGLEAEGVAHCREGLARIGRRGGRDQGSKEWADQLAWWEAQAADDRRRAAVWSWLRRAHERAASRPWEGLAAVPPEPSPVPLLPPPDLPAFPPR